MTVKDLLCHFEIIPDKVRYFDDDSEKEIVLFDPDTCTFYRERWDEFLKKYSDHFVLAWKYYRTGDWIYLSITREKTDAEIH